MEDKPPANETTDPDGERVVLLDAVWREKIVQDHPEIAAHRSAVLRAVSTPDHVASDPSSGAHALLRARRRPESWLLVVVSYEQTPARIVSAFANRKDPKSWSA